MGLAEENQPASPRHVVAPGLTTRGSGYGVRLSKAEDFLFTRRRLAVLGYSLLAAWASAFAMRFYTGSWVFDRAGHPTFIDFIQWWVAGQFGLMRNAAGAYNFATYSAAQALLAKSTPPISYYYFVYPPTMLLLQLSVCSRLRSTRSFQLRWQSFWLSCRCRS